MKKFIAFMEKYVVPVAAKIGGEPHLAAIRDGFVTIIPVIMIGAMGILVNNITKWHVYVNFMTSVFGEGWKGWGGNVWNASYGIMSLLVCFTIAYHLTSSRGKDGLAVGVVSVGVLVLFIVNIGSAKNVGFLGTDGLLLAIVIALIVSDLMCLLLGNPKLIIKMPEGVPPAVAKSFASLFPTMIVVGGASILQELYLMCHTGVILPALFNKWIQTPLQGVVSSFWGVLILILVIQVLWFFGLHGSNMMFPIVQGVLFPLTIANMQAIEHGEKAKYIINDQFLNSFCNMGGSGLTICLIAAIFIVNKKSSAQQKMIGKLGIAPAIFNINEPVIFGLPICLDPIYVVPFIVAPLFNAVVTYFTMVAGMVPYPTVEVFWTVPPILSAIVGTRSWQGGVLAIILLVIDIIIYIPFVIVAGNRDKDLQEANEAAEVAAQNN